MAEEVTPVPSSVSWDPIAPNAVLLADDFARAVLALDPHPDDTDSRAVVYIWEGVRHASMGSPNDEARSGHRLYDKGLADLLGLGLVQDSELIASLERDNRVHPFHEPEWYASMSHHILALKESTVEIVASTVRVVRVSGSTVHAAVAAAEPDTAVPPRGIDD
ncbi:MAG: hypothetical protein ABIQ01_06765 [Pseudolysinimonas sp.]